MKLIEVLSIRKRDVGEKFYITNDTSGPTAIAIVVKIIVTATGFLYFCKLVGG